VVNYIGDGPTTPTTYDNANLNFDLNLTDPTTPTGSTNIKNIAVTLSSAAGQPGELDKTITLQAFSCNIGSYTLEER